MAVSELNTGSASSGVSHTFGTVSAGTDRLITAGYAEFLQSGASITGSVAMTFGGQSLTKAAEYETSFGSDDSYSGVFYGNDALIAAASGTSLAVTGYGATNRGGLGMMVWQNAEQTSPVGNTANAGISSGATVSTSITVNADNAAFAISDAFGNGAGNPSVSSVGADFTNEGTWDAFASTEGVILSRDEGGTGGSRTCSVTYSLTNHTASLQVCEFVQPLGAVEQEGFRFRNDDGSESTATWRQSQDVNDSIARDTNIRLRILLNGSSLPAASGYTLEYKKSGDSDSEYRAIPTS